MHLNSTRYAFKVNSEKLLEYIVHQREIDLNPERK